MAAPASYGWPQMESGVVKGSAAATSPKGPAFEVGPPACPSPLPSKECFAP